MLFVGACISVSTLQCPRVIVCMCVIVEGKKDRFCGWGFLKKLPKQIVPFITGAKTLVEHHSKMHRWYFFLEWPAKEQNINKSFWLEEGGMFSNFKNIICPRNSFFSWTPSLSVLPKAKSFAKMIFYQSWGWCWRVSGWFVWVLVIHWGDHLFVPLTLDSN